MADIFGPIFVAVNLEQAVIDTLKSWLRLYINEVQLQVGVTGSIPMPRTYTTRRRFDKFPEDQLPTCVVVSPGLDSDPKKEGDGSYRAKWVIHVGMVVSTSDMVQTNLVAKIYGAAMRAAIIQHASLGGIVCGMEWYDESYDDLPDDDVTRSLGATTLSFRVEVEEVVNWNKGPDGVFLPDPADPDTPPNAQPGDQDHVVPDIGHIVVQIQKEAL